MTWLTLSLVVLPRLQLPQGKKNITAKSAGAVDFDNIIYQFLSMKDVCHKNLIVF